MQLVLAAIEKRPFVMQYVIVEVRCVYVGTPCRILLKLLSEYFCIIIIKVAF